MKLEIKLPTQQQTLSYKEIMTQTGIFKSTNHYFLNNNFYLLVNDHGHLLALNGITYSHGQDPGIMIVPQTNSWKNHTFIKVCDLDKLKITFTYD